MNRLQIEISAGQSSSLAIRGHQEARATLSIGASPTDTLINGVYIPASVYVNVPHDGVLYYESTTDAVVFVELLG